MALRRFRRARERARCHERSPRHGGDEVYRVAFEHAPVAVGVCDGDGRFVSANAALAGLLGRDVDSLVGRPFLTFVHPDARAASLARYFQSVVIAASQSRWRPEQHEMPCLAADGSVVWVAVTWTVTAPDPAGDQRAVVHLVDVTQRRQAERAAADLAHRFELTFQCSPIGFAILDLHGRLVQVNPVLQDMLGYPAEELRGRTFLEITHPEDRASAAAVFQRLVAGVIDRDTSVKRYRTRTGATIYARRVAAVLHDGPTPRYLLLQIENITGEREAREALRAQAVRDKLTGLANRESLAEELQMSRAAHSLVMVALTDLTRLNGAFGRDGSNEILRSVARRLTASCRPEDRVARVGSAQFAILIINDPATAAELAHRVATTLAAPVTVGDTTVVVNTSVASVHDPTGNLDLDALLQRGDLATTRDPTLDPHRTPTQFSQAMLTTSTREVAVESELRNALAVGGLTLAYQPIVDLNTGAPSALEVLSRWDHATLGTVTPAEFIPAAERSGLIHDLTAWTLHTACADLARWNDTVPQARTIALAVNVAPRCLLLPDFADEVRDILTANALPGRQLIVEVTEASLAQESCTVLNNLHALHQAGIRISIDDFGTGQSCLDRVARYPVTEIKLDRSFIAHVQNPSDDAPLVRAGVALATELNLTLTVEGVETATQLALLHRYHCPQGQGFLLGRPQTAEQTQHTLSTPRKPLGAASPVDAAARHNRT